MLIEIKNLYLCAMKNKDVLSSLDATFDRRSFLEAGTLTLGSFLLPAFGTRAGFGEQPTGLLPGKKELGFGQMAYFAEAGNYKEDAHYVLGMLSVQDSAQAESAIAALRTQYNYRTKLTWHSTDKYKIMFCNALLDYFVQTGTLRFTARAYPWGGGNSKLSFGQLSLEKVDYFNNLELELGQRPLKSYLKSHSPFGPSIFFKGKCQQITGHDILPLNTRLSNLLQLSGLLTGCVLRDIKGPAQSHVKTAVIDQLKQKLGVFSLASGTDVTGKFKVL